MLLDCMAWCLRPGWVKIFMYWHALQANAEPDMKQTGKRLKGIVAGLVEGTLGLALDQDSSTLVSSLSLIRKADSVVSQGRCL